MKFGNAPDLGRFIVDIDGCLRATHLSSLSPAEVVAMHGSIEADRQVALEVYDAFVMLADADRVELREETVAFFRTMPTPSSARVGAYSARERVARFQLAA